MQIKEEKAILTMTLALGIVAACISYVQNEERKQYETFKARSGTSTVRYYEKAETSKESQVEKAITYYLNGTSSDYEGYSENTIEEFVIKDFEPEYESLIIPYGDCSNYMYMDYRALTNTASKQWELQQYAYTDWQGIRVYDGCYMVAMGTFYGNVGDKFRITTDWGNVYNVIMGDAKGWDSVDGWYHVAGDGRINVVEFIVDTYAIDGYAATMGDMGVLDNIGGDIVKIERID